MIYRYGGIKINNAIVSNYGITAPLNDNSTDLGSTFELIVLNSDQTSDIVNLKNISASGANIVRKSFIRIENDTSTVGDQSLSTNIYLDGISISNCSSSLTLIYLDTTNLVWSFNKISIVNNTKIKSSAVYIQNGGYITFNNSTFYGNIGISR